MRLYILSFFLLLGVTQAQAQQPTRSELEKRRANLLEEINSTQQQLEATKQDKKATMSELKALTAKLEARQKLIGNINAELSNIDGSIQFSAQEINTLNSNLDKLKASYAQSIRYAYKHRTSQNMMAFLFSANDFNDAIRRMQYLRKYRDYRKEQADKIRVTQVQLKQKIGVLNTQKTQKGKLLQTEEVQKNEIQAETQQTNQLVTELKGREKELVAQIQQNQKMARKLEASIRDQIRREIELARKKAEEEARRKAAEEAALARKRAAEEEARRKAAAAQQAARNNDGNTYQAGSQTVTLNTGRPSSTGNNASKPATTGNSKPAATTSEPSRPAYTPPPVASVEKPSYKLSLTPEVQALSNNFAANRGRLPWPVEKGFISGNYGKHPNKLFPSVIENNIGIDITTGEGASVRAVYEGVVRTVANINGIMVMVSHGEFFTVYSNLASASVREGDHVSAKQVIGRAGKNDDGENMLNFQVWKVGANNSPASVNPSDWIAR
ncbi:murein hydrolase activator EnvC family protein [Taibaiella koreensis]|uniref:murein hydrolase activator EnvC family protein n=1 Tax=Taibaiella koreensis TaxID=1268548 RepID=UPI000E59BCB2|nr:peptidoglycan DD-metalloendopeptidase family protein [Taibaiella koreensis]